MSGGKDINVPSNDLISRQAAIDTVRSYYDEYYADDDSIEELLEKLPSAQPDPDEWCHDCKEYDQERHCCPRWNRVIRNTLEDAQPERKKGKWIHDGCNIKGGIDWMHCSECGHKDLWNATTRTPFCGWCGARMGVSDES